MPAINYEIDVSGVLEQKQNADSTKCTYTSLPELNYERRFYFYFLSFSSSSSSSSFFSSSSYSPPPPPPPPVILLVAEKLVVTKSFRFSEMFKLVY
jgi:hypothetical protein